MTDGSLFFRLFPLVQRHHGCLRVEGEEKRKESALGVHGPVRSQRRGEAVGYRRGRQEREQEHEYHEEMLEVGAVQ